jgi:hypothetical protein
MFPNNTEVSMKLDLKMAQSPNDDGQSLQLMNRLNQHVRLPLPLQSSSSSSGGPSVPDAKE